jgi:hypothetical protein
MKMDPMESTTVAEVKLADAVLEIRKLQTEKHNLLLRSAEVWAEKSRDTSLTAELRSIHADRSRRARAEARELAKELGI